MSLTIISLFEMEVPVQQGRGKCTSLRTPTYANNCKPNIFRGFSIQISIKKQRQKCTPLRTPANTVNLIRS